MYHRNTIHEVEDETRESRDTGVHQGARGCAREGSRDVHRSTRRSRVRRLVGRSRVSPTPRTPGVAQSGRETAPVHTHDSVYIELCLMSIASVSVTLPGGVGMLEPRVGRVTGLNRAGVRTPRESTVEQSTRGGLSRAVHSVGDCGTVHCDCRCRVDRRQRERAAASRRAAFYNIQSLNELARRRRLK